MKRDISKLCADSLRTLANEEYGTKLKSAHAHELVAAYFGYRSRNALLADKNHPISALAQAQFLVTVPDEFFSNRRNSLVELSPDLPDNGVLYKAIHSALVSNKLARSPFPPFSDFDRLGKYLVSNSHQYQAAFPFHHRCL